MAGVLRVALVGSAAWRRTVLHGLKELHDRGWQSFALTVVSQETEPEPGQGADLPSLEPVHLAAEPRTVASAADFWAEPADDVDAVADPDPPRAAAALGQGWHVLTGSPAATAPALARAWQAAAAARGLVLAAAAWQRHSALTGMLRAAVQAGVLGRLTELRLGAAHPGEGLLLAEQLLGGPSGDGVVVREESGSGLWVTGERGRCHDGWLQLPEGEVALVTWYARHSGAAARAQLLPCGVQDTRALRLAVWLEAIREGDGGPAAEFAREAELAHGAGAPGCLPRGESGARTAIQG